MTGTVYFLRVGDDGPIKIGFTSGYVHNRIRVLQQTSPHELRWIGFFIGELSDEKAAHSLLSASLLRAEWFHPTPEVLAFVNEKCASFDEASYFRDVIHQDCLDAAMSVTKHLKTENLISQLLIGTNMSRADYNKWVALGYPPSRVDAERVAENARAILAAQ